MAAENEKPPLANIASVTRIPGYKIKGVLGRGGMAVVYLAVQESIGREVALKVLVPDHSDESFTQRFLAEARIISQLSHPNIVTVFDAGVHQGNHYMAMEYVKGKTLTDARNAMSLAQRINVIRQIADALDYAGSKGYVHRDIKPENIMCNEEGRAILMDFGIARSLDATRGLTVTGKAIGTPYYMSPEQTKGLKVDPRSDIYSLGVVLFQMLAGRVPYDGPSFVAIGIKQISEPIPLLPPGFEAFQQIINNSMSKEAGHRYQTAGEMKAALESLPATVLQRQAAKPIPASTPTYDTSTLAEIAVAPVVAKSDDAYPPVSVGPIRQSAPSFRAEYRRQELPPIDVTGSMEFKRLRRRRWLLFLLLLSSLAYAAYQRQDGWLPWWQYDIAPWLAANVPSAKQILEYLPPAKKRPDTVQVSPLQTPRPARATEFLPVVKPGQTKANATSPAAAVNTPVQTVDAPLAQEGHKTTPIKLTAEQEQSEKIDALLAGMDKYSENALKLAILYKSVLVHDRANQEAARGLADLQRWFGKEIRRAIDQKEWAQSRLLLNMLKESFPTAVQEEPFHYMQLQTETAERLQAYLRKAAQYRQAGHRIKPQGANALEEYNKALQLAPGNLVAKRGLQQIADDFYQRARQQQKIGDIQAALNSTNAGLQAMSEHSHLLALQEELQLAMRHQQNLRGLLANARSQLVSGNLLTPHGRSAYDIFQVVLAESPANPAAVKGLERIERVLVQQIQSLMKQGQYRQAQQQLTRAQAYFHQSRALNFLQRKLTRETYREPVVTN